MTSMHKLSLTAALCLLPALANAQTKPAETASVANCPMAQTGAMQKDMSAMMGDMSAMMKDTNDPAMKTRMHKMHEQMAAMMASMRKRGGGMMSGGMMGGSMMRDKPDTTTPLAKPDDHAAHHPSP